MTQLWQECGAGRCQFRDPTGGLGNNLPANPNRYGRLQAYEATDDPTAECGSHREAPVSCACFIVVQRVVRRTGVIEVESLYKGNPNGGLTAAVPGASEPIGPLTQSQRQQYDRDDRHEPHWQHTYLARCLQLEPNPHKGWLEPVRLKP